jgi:hypothetical protein
MVTYRKRKIMNIEVAEDEESKRTPSDQSSEGAEEEDK